MRRWFPSDTVVGKEVIALPREVPSEVWYRVPLVGKDVMI